MTKDTQGPAKPVVLLSPGDLDAIEALRAANNETLGFLPKQVIKDYLGHNGGFGIRGGDGVTAYCLFARHKHHLRIIHLCVDAHARGGGHARSLVNAVVGEAKGHRVGVVRLNCRRDYPANAAWPKPGFIPIDERAAKTPGASLVTWCRGIPGAAQEDIFSTLASDDKVNAVIDAQLLFQIHSLDDDVAKGLQADFLADLLALHIADETFNEIDRARSADQRRRSRNLAQIFPRVQHDVDRASVVERDLRQILPSSTPSQRSDIRQIAMTATSNVNIFLTRDGPLLRKAAAVHRLTSVEVLHPNSLIVRLAEYTDRQPYSPLPIAGMNLAWRRIGEGDIPSIGIDTLLGPRNEKALSRRAATTCCPIRARGALKRFGRTMR